MKRTLLIALVVVTACGSSEEHGVETALRTGARHYRSGHYAQADTAFALAPSDARAVFNRGDADHRLGAWKEAITYFDQAASLASDPMEQAGAYHNSGSTRLAEALQADTLVLKQSKELAAIKIEGDDIAQKVNLIVRRDSLQRMNQRMEALIDSSLAEAIEKFKHSLRRAPSDEDSRYNLALAQRIVSTRIKEGRGKGDGNDDKDKDKELTERAKAILQRADELVEVYKFQEALDVLQQGLKEDPTLKAKKEYVDKLDLVTKAAKAT